MTEGALRKFAVDGEVGDDDSDVFGVPMEDEKPGAAEKDDKLV